MTPRTSERRSRAREQVGVQSVEIAVRIVAVLAQAHQPLMLRDLAKAVGLHPAKAHRYLVSLARQGMIEQDGTGGRYGLGPLALGIGLAALHQLDVVRIGSAAVADLRDRIDQTALLAVWGSAGATVVCWEECRRPVAVNVRVGSALGLLDSATGLVFAAFLPRPHIESRLDEEMRDHDPVEVGQRLAEVRSHGMSFVRGNQLASINAMSAPIFDHARNLVAAITVLGPERRFSVGWDNDAARELLAVSRRVSERLGLPHVGGDPA